MRKVNDSYIPMVWHKSTVINPTVFTQNQMAMPSDDELLLLMGYWFFFPFFFVFFCFVFYICFGCPWWHFFFIFGVLTHAYTHNPNTTKTHKTTVQTTHHPHINTRKKIENLFLFQMKQDKIVPKKKKKNERNEKKTSNATNTTQKTNVTMQNRSIVF